jgi:methionine-gamma-lyase
MEKHSQNAMYLAEGFRDIGLKFIYPGMPDHPQYELLKRIMSPAYGFGGLIAIDVGTAERAGPFMEMMQDKGVGYHAVSLGYFKTLFSNSGKSTSSEVPVDVQKEIGLSEGLIRFSVGLDHDIKRTFDRIKSCLVELKYI